MSIQAMTWVLTHSGSTLADRLVLLAIANHCDASGWNAWPAIDRVAHEARVDRRTVFRAIEALEASGELLVQRRPGRSNVYGIAALVNQEGWQIVTPQGVADCHPGVTSTAQRGDILPPKPLRTVKEPLRGRARVREATDTSPIPTTPPPAVRMPLELDEATRARGAAFFRQLRGKTIDLTDQDETA